MPCLSLPLHSSMNVSFITVSCSTTMWAIGVSTDPEAEHASVLVCVIHGLTACLSTERGKSITYRVNTHMVTGSGRAGTDSERKACLLGFSHLFQQHDLQPKQKAIREPLGTLPYLFTVRLGKKKHVCLQLQWSWPLRLFS